MTTLNDYKSPEKDILISIFNEYSNKGIPLLDSINVSSIIENMIYENVEEYYDNGSLKCKYTLRFGEKDGLFQRWFENGQKRVECNYKYGKLEGRSLYWWYNGQKMEECHFREGHKEGMNQSWFDNGQKEVECYYRDREVDGLYQSWWENGQKRVECTYRNGKKEGYIDNGTAERIIQSPIVKTDNYMSIATTRKGKGKVSIKSGMRMGKKT